jgi:copper chaperone CopZ
MTRFLFTIMLCLAVCARADEQTSKHRLIGLSAPERIADLRETMASLSDVRLVSLDADAAEITVSYDWKILFPNHPPKKPAPTAEEIEKRLSDVIGIACARTFSLKPLSVVPKDKLTKIEISIGILDCKACRFAVYNSVSTIDGVERASVDAKSSVISAWIDATKTNREDLEKALKKARVELVGK